MTEPRPEPPWLSLTEAAEVTGVAREAIRSRARRGLIPNRRNNAGELVVQIVTDPDRVVTAGKTDPDQAMTAHDRVMTGLVTDLQAEIADLRTALARSETEADAAKRIAMAEVAAKDELLTELKALLAEERRPWWRRWMG